MKDNLTGKIIVITGASSGLGEGTARPVSFARMVAFAISQPDDVDVNEILFRPTSQDL